MDKLLYGLLGTALVFTTGSSAWHDFVTVPTVETVVESQACDNCYRECERTCKENNIDPCDCSHCRPRCP